MGLDRGNQIELFQQIPLCAQLLKPSPFLGHKADIAITLINVGG